MQFASTLVVLPHVEGDLLLSEQALPSALGICCAAYHTGNFFRLGDAPLDSASPINVAWKECLWASETGGMACGGATHRHLKYKASK